MGVINTTKSIMGALRNQPPEPQPHHVPGADEIEEDDPDREGNTEPGTNAPPDEGAEGDEDELFTEDPVVVRRKAMAEAARAARLRAMQEAEENIPAEEPVKGAVIIDTLHYLTIGGTSGQIRVSGRAANGEPFHLQLPYAANASALDLADFLKAVVADHS